MFDKFQSLLGIMKTYNVSFRAHRAFQDLLTTQPYLLSLNGKYKDTSNETGNQVIPICRV